MQRDERFKIKPLPLSGACLIARKKLGDDRGFLERFFCGRELAESIGFGSVAQINRTYTSAAGVVRGMHYQVSSSVEGKIITCLRGAVLDVIVDIRRGSPTLLQHIKVELKSDDGTSLFVPRGFAHGFQTIEPDTELLYLHDNYYDEKNETGLFPLDPMIGIQWPLKINQMSNRDQNHPKISINFEGIFI